VAQVPLTQYGFESGWEETTLCVNIWPCNTTLCAWLKHSNAETVSDIQVINLAPSYFPLGNLANEDHWVQNCEKQVKETQVKETGVESALSHGVT
jgi:hypothetical protein